eukprot:CAMPEP_0172635680 /NCGR_PEP_ID=MMETSP1068-20121228/200575_1 /TAXON_ID=35684 /ORGANISM="Pseudopedinella elastica, Strain CCMP716" /LENGTH=250 /DNA_ID=CAMNT_0013447973 /DNA_START=147 /DNA_END=898 /DNA_ORIENTATION=+
MSRTSSPVNPALPSTTTGDSSEEGGWMVAANAAELDRALARLRTLLARSAKARGSTAIGSPLCAPPVCAAVASEAVVFFLCAAALATFVPFDALFGATTVPVVAGATPKNEDVTLEAAVAGHPVQQLRDGGRALPPLRKPGAGGGPTLAGLPPSAPRAAIAAAAQARLPRPAPGAGQLIAALISENHASPERAPPSALFVEKMCRSASVVAGRRERPVAQLKQFDRRPMAGALFSGVSTSRDPSGSETRR